MPNEFPKEDFLGKREVRSQETQKRIIDFLSAHPEEAYTLLEIAGQLSLSYMTIVRYIADLERAGIVRMKKSMENVKGARPLKKFKLADHSRLD